MDKRAGLGVGFLIASICGLALGLLIPSLLPFVALGIALGISPLVLRRLTRAAPNSRSRVSSVKRLSLIAAACLGVAGIAAIVALTAGHSRTSPRAEAIHITIPPVDSSAGGDFHHLEEATYPPGFIAPPEEPAFRVRTLAIGVTYTGEASPKSDSDHLELIDRLKMRRSSFRPMPGALARLARKLKAKHWHSAEEEGDGRVIFKRRRDLSLRSRIFPPETGNTIALPRIVFEDPRNDVTMKLRFGSASRLILLADPETFGPSYPQGVREARPASGLEQMAIPVGERGTVEVDVRSPLFRNELLGGVADLTIPGIFKWILGFLATALIALFNDEIKEKMKRAWRRLRPRVRTATS